MTRKGLGLASGAAVAAMLLVSLIVGAGLSDGLRLPTHWNIAGEADGFASKWTALMIPPGTIAALSLLFWFLPAIEPRAKGLERSQGLYLWGWAALLFMGVVIEFVLVAVALGWDVPVNQVMVASIGAMLIPIGNQLGKSRSMYLIGLRTPWTLASEEVWIKTHRLAGKLMVAGGLIAIAAAALPLPSGLLGTVMIAVIAIAAAVPIVYSLLLWRREKAQSSGYRSTAE